MQNLLPGCFSSSFLSRQFNLIEYAFCAALAQTGELLKVCFTHVKDFLGMSPAGVGVFFGILPIQIGEGSSQ